MSDQPSIVIRAALAGNLFDKSKNPNIPFGEDQLIASTVECVKAGASELHIHLRDQETGDPVFSPARYQHLKAGIHAALQKAFPEQPEMWEPVISFTTTQKGIEEDPFFVDSGSPNPTTHPTEFAELRGRTIVARPDLAPITDPSNKVLDKDLGEVPYHAAYTQAKALVEMAKHYDVTPECEIQHPYFVDLIERLLHDGTLPEHPRVQTLFGHTEMPIEQMDQFIDTINERLRPRTLILGARFRKESEGRPALIVPETLSHELDLATQKRADGKQKVTGIRVGLEDNFGIVGKEPAETTNATMVKTVAQMAKEKGIKVLNPAEARRFTGLAIDPETPARQPRPRGGNVRLFAKKRSPEEGGGVRIGDSLSGEPAYMRAARHEPRAAITRDDSSEWTKG